MAPSHFLWRRGNGIYYLTVQLPNGKKQYHSLGTKDKLEAVALAKEFFSLPSNSPAQQQKVSLSEFLKRFGNYHSHVKPRTLEGYLKSCSSFLKVVGDKALGDYTSLDVEKFKISRLESIRRNSNTETVKPASVNVDLRGVKTAFSRAKKLKLVSSSPFEGVALCRIPKTVPAYLTLEETKNLVERITNPMLKAVVISGISTGCRLGEVAELKWNQVDLERRILSITKTKTGSTRVLPISSMLLECLKSFPRRSEWVFSKPSGYPYSSWYLSRQFKKLILRAGLNPTLHFHSLRHSFASNLVKQNVSLFTVSQLLGHADIKTTLVYSHLETSTLHSVVDKLNL